MTPSAAASAAPTFGQRGGGGGGGGDGGVGTVGGDGGDDVAGDKNEHTVLQTEFIDELTRLTGSRRYQILTLLLAGRAVYAGDARASGRHGPKPSTRPRKRSA